MKKLLMIIALALPGIANADVLNGVYQTEPGDSGGFLHVQMGPCADDATQTCGTILRAYTAEGTYDKEYAHLGKPIVWEMADLGGDKWGNGKIWAPDRDKTYNSKMELKGSILQVKGCVLFICRDQNWVVVP